jgi:hypothetical protein
MKSTEAYMSFKGDNCVVACDQSRNILGSSSLLGIMQALNSDKRVCG